MRRVFVAAAIAATILLGASAARAADQNWEITGTIQVEESATTGKNVVRPLKGVAVEVHGADVGRIYASWGTVYTDSSGKFTLRKEKNKNKRHFKVRVRFQDKDRMLTVKEGFLSEPFASDWNTVFETSDDTDGPKVSIGTRTFRTGASGVLGERERVRRAATFYMCKSVMDRLESEGGGLEFTRGITIAYPARVISGVPYANGITRTAYIHESPGNTGWWSADTVLHELMHLWNYQHNSGTSNWLQAVWDGSTHSFNEHPAIAFHEGFAEWAMNEWMTLLWGRARVTPASRRSLAQNDLNAITAVEKNDNGVTHALHLLTTPNIFGWSFGTSTKAPSGSSDTGGPGSFTGAVQTSTSRNPQSPNIGFFDVLRVFLPHPDKGWPKAWDVGNKNLGLVEFYRRASDILGGGSTRFTKDRKAMYLELLDATLTREPEDYL